MGSKVIESKLKTLREWCESKKRLGDFIDNDDIICDELALYLLEVFPPVYMTKNCFQLGEPVTQINNKPVYMTFSLENKGWVFIGYMHEKKGRK